MMNRLRAIGFSFALTSLLAAPGHANDTPRPSLVLTAEENGTVPQDEFSCDGKIHGYLRLPRRQTGPHVLEARWIKPDGKVAAESHDPLTFEPPGRSTAYIWFTFPERAKSLSALDPKSDEDRLTFNGKWKVEVTWDHEPLVTSTFTVRCL